MRDRGAMRGGLWLAAAMIMQLALWSGLASPALAQNECGPMVGPGNVVMCDSSGLNPYIGGITYNTTTGINLTVESGIVVARTPENDKAGITVNGTGNDTLLVNLVGGAIIGTEGWLADGVNVQAGGTGISDIFITSGANITVLAANAVRNGSGTNGIAGRINNGDSNGGIHISQLVGSTIAMTGIEGSGIYGYHAGSGSVTLESAGIITTNGIDGNGLFAWNRNDLSTGTVKSILATTGQITTRGQLGLGVYSLNEGYGDTLADIDGVIETWGFEAEGTVTYVNSAQSSAKSEIILRSNSVNSTHGEFARAVRALSDGDGDVTIRSSGVVLTVGDRSSGLNANAYKTSSTGTMTVAMMGTAVVETTGQLAHGVVADHRGGGVVDVDIGAGTSVTAIGEMSRGIVAMSATGPANIKIGADAIVTGGWQGAAAAANSAGVFIASGGAGVLDNEGIISAWSDRAIAGGALSGDLTIDNARYVTGFVELAGAGANVFNNNSGGLFDIRNFADTNSDHIRDTKGVAISNFGTSSSSFANAAGARVRLASVGAAASVVAAGYYVPTVGSGAGRPLEASFYDLNRVGVVQGQFTSLGSFSNAGVIDLRGAAIGNTLVMTDNAAAGGAAGTGVFVSDGGQLLINTVLNAGLPLAGQTGSFSDVLVVDSTSLGTGATTITVVRREGAGAGTPGNGILVVEVRNKTASVADAFVLNGDFVVGGAQAVVQGAHYYHLLHNGVAADAGDGNWYLRNAGYSPNVPIYEDYPKLLKPLIEVPTLSQRAGNRYWLDPTPAREPQTVFCKDAASNFRCAVTDEQAEYYLDQADPVTIDGTGLWGRIEAARTHMESPTSLRGTLSDSNIWRLQAGVDSLLQANDDGTLIGGLTVQYGNVGSEITAPGAAGSISANGYGVGGTLTWYGESGFYADAQAQLNWFGSTLTSATLGRTLVKDNPGFGYALSLEAGQRVALDSHWAVTPQAQLTFSSVTFDSFTDPFGTKISLLSGESLTGRLGLATEYQRSWRDDNGEMARLSAHGVANLYNEFLGGALVDISGVHMASRDDRLWGGLGLGGTYDWSDGKYALHGEISTRTSLENFGKSYELGATLGLRVKW